MIFDLNNLFSNAQAITATAASTNIIDLGAPGTVYGAAAALVRDIGPGNDVPIRVQVVESFNNLTSLTADLQSDDNSGFASPATVWTSGAVPLASLVAGYVFNMEDVPRRSNERYLRMNYTVTGSAPTLGKITAGIVAANQSNG